MWSGEGSGVDCQSDGAGQGGGGAGCDGGHLPVEITVEPVDVNDQGVLIDDPVPLAVGIRVALHPQIDLATEPRWARANATFGEDAELTSRLVKAYIRGFQGVRAAGYGTVVATPEEADIAIVRLAAPYEPRSGTFESFFHAGGLAFPEAEIARLRVLQGKADTVVGVYLERPAVFPEIAEGAAAVLGDSGANDAAFLDVVFGRRSPLGRLPYELPRSMAAVEASRSDMPYDSADPLYPFGHGLSY
ncbi:glycoside hydrolase family 3 C-terminal domain-containing protein [Streptosporangium canum]|uniref:glycoside hydrolase family 3 C-terminal domain-containing protein n=1 Tax=Streptosporangium canum TaxID=324952 RepID=UPI0037A0BE15